jgi:hypothetical protein
MKTQLRKSALTLAVAACLGASGAVYASDTSSAMRGKITTPAGEAAANVKIKVIHEPSGTVTEYVTNEAGAFLAKGLRVGGPYTIVIDSDTFKDVTKERVYLSLGKTSRITEQLEPLSIETIQVTGTRYTQQSGGANSAFGEDIIRNAPSFNRDINDIVRINPLATMRGNELTIAGNNPRTNALTVDGISQNDDFGLSYSGYSTQQPPVSLDAVEQITVDFAPFSASKGNFGGGTVNAVTKSGTNEFKFSGYAETSTPSMTGDNDSIRTVTFINDRGRTENLLDDDGHRTFETVKNEPIQTETRVGFTVGAPIIKDELFIFTSYTNWSSEYEMDYDFAANDGTLSDATHAFDMSRAEFDEFLGILNNTYGIQDALGGDPKDTNQSLITKITWNIDDSHRLDFTYQWQDDKDQRNFATGGSTVDLASSRYDYVTKFNNFSTKLYSDWNDDFSTEISIAYKDVSHSSQTNSDLGSMTVYVDGGRGNGIAFGRDEFRHANEAETETTILSFDGTYLLGDHEINFGVKYEELSLYNLFAQNSLGSWEFDSFEDFANRQINAYNFSYANAYTNNAKDTAYDATRSQLALYIEDTFYPHDDVELKAGIRYERLSSSDKPLLNESFLSEYGFSNQENLDGLDIILPRIGFQWFASDDLTVKGGIGRFQGGIPNVWYNNPFQNDGITLVQAPTSAINDYFENNAADITEVPQAIKDSLVPGAGSTNYTDPDFELPSSWRAQLGFDYNFSIEGFGDDYIWSAELAYEKKQNEAVWHNTALVREGLAADGERIIYGSRYEGDDQREDNFDIMMTNAKDDGRSLIFLTSLAKNWDNGVSLTLSYTHQDIEENQAGSSSRAQSNYKHNVTKSRNQDLVARGHYEVEHSFKINLNYKTEFFDGYETRFDMFFERRSGRPFSYVMGSFRDEDLGDTVDFYSNSAYLPYIPTGADDPNVNWDASRISWDELETLLNRAGISARGQILDRNAFTQPWVTTMDVKVTQELPGFKEGHKAQLYFMVDNFANLLNSDWGIEKRLQYPNQTLYDFGGLDDEGRYILSDRYQGADVRNYSMIDAAGSAWQAKIGVSYKF